MSIEITSPPDWSECGGTLTVSASAPGLAWQTATFRANGLAKATAPVQADGSVSASVVLDSAAIVGLDTIETLTVTIGGESSAAVRVIPRDGRLVVDGASTVRLLHTATALCNRIRLGGTWGGETVALLLWMREWGLTRPTWLMPVQPWSDAPGWQDGTWMDAHASRRAGAGSGATTAVGLAFGGAPTPGNVSHVGPSAFYLRDVAAAYYRGQRSAYHTHLARMIAFVRDVPVDANGLPRIHVPFQLPWAAYYYNGQWNLPQYPEAEGVAWSIWAVDLVRRMAALEGDAATESECAAKVATWRSAVTAALVRSDGLLYPVAHQLVPADEKSVIGTALGVGLGALSTSQLDAAADGLLSTYVDRTSGSGSYCKGATLPATGYPMDLYPEEEGGGYQTYTPSHWFGFTAPFAASLARSDASLGRTLAEDNVRAALLFHRLGSRKWVGWSLAGCNAFLGGGTHYGSGVRDITATGSATWLKNATDPHGDLAPIVVSGSQGSESAWVELPWGHRITSATVAASQSCTATLEVVAGEDQTVWDEDQGTWPPAPRYGADRVIKSIGLVGEASVEDCDGWRPIGCFGGRVRVRVSSVTGTTPGSFTVTLHQPRLTVAVRADPTLGFSDHFRTNRLTEYAAIEGAPGDWSLSSATMAQTAGAGWHTLVQGASSFSDGVIHLERVAGFNPSYAAIFRASADGQTYIKIVAEPTGALTTSVPIGKPYYRLRCDEVVGGVVASSQSTEIAGDIETSERLPSSLDTSAESEKYLLVRVEGATVLAMSWAGKPWSADGGPFWTRTSNQALYRFTVSHVMGAGRAGFGILGATTIDAVRIGGAQEQPIPPGMVLDTGLDVATDETVLWQAFVTGEAVSPASDRSVLRNEWGAPVSAEVDTYNMRWTYPGSNVPGPLPSRTVPAGGSASWTVDATTGPRRLRATVIATESGNARILVDGVEVGTFAFAGDEFQVAPLPESIYEGDTLQVVVQTTPAPQTATPNVSSMTPSSLSSGAPLSITWSP